MNFPVYLQLGAFRIHPHPFFETLAYIIGFRTFLSVRRRNGDSLSSERRVVVICAAAAGAFLGSRLLGVLETDAFWNGDTSLSLLSYLQFKTVAGGLLGGILAVELIKWIINQKSSTGDIFVTPLIVAICIGRIGCFLSGLDDVTYGLPSELPISFDVGDGIRRHPVALYEIAALCLIAGSAWLARAVLSKHVGLRFKWFIFWYCLFRVFVDGFKPNYKLIAGLSAIQLACVVAAVAYGFQMLRLLRKSNGRAGFNNRFYRFWKKFW